MVDYAVEIISDERLVELFEYWLAKCGRRKMPTREDFDPSEISPLLPHLMMIDAIDGGAEFRVRLVGTALTEPTGGNATGQTLRDITPPGPFADYVVGLYEEVVEVARPIYAECEHFDPELQPHSTARLIMPLSQDGINVDCALVGQIYTTATPDAVVHKADEAGYFEEGVRVLLK